MNWLRNVRGLFRALFQKGHVDGDMAAEMRSHIEMQTQENIDAGMAAEEARRSALREFGWAESIKETCREQRGIMWVENLLRDLRFGARMLRKNPVSTLAMVFTLALGIGSTSAVFALIDGALLTPPPYSKPQQLVLISPAKVGGGQFPFEVGPTTEQWTEWREQAKSFSAMAGYDWNFDFLIQANASELMTGLEITHDYFKVLGIKPLLGRTFFESDEPKLQQPQTAIILGYNLWRRKFSGDTRILGQKINISRHAQPLTVIGVMPANVRFLPSLGESGSPNYNIHRTVDYWLPIAPDMSQPTSFARNGMWSVVARLSDGKTFADAQAEMTAVAAKQAQKSGRYREMTARLQPVEAVLNREGKLVLLPLFGAVCLVFLIACGNVIGLMLAKGVQRQQELAIRCALGAKQIQLFRQVIAESTLLAAFAGVLGAGLAFGTVKLLKAFGGTAIPRLDMVSVGTATLAFCCGASILAAVLAGLVPALRASRLDPMHALRAARLGGSVSGKDRRFLTAVAILQTALTMGLLIGAGLLIQTVRNLANVRPGFETQHILTMSIAKDGAENNYLFHTEAIRRVSALPGVKSAAFVWGLPLTGDGYAGEIPIGGRATGDRSQDKVMATRRFVTPDYFDTIGIKIIEGRGFTMEDTALNWKNFGTLAPGEAPFVAIINEALAKSCFPGTSAIGKKLYDVEPAPGRPKEIVGIIPNVRSGALFADTQPEIYYPFFQRTVFAKHFVVRTELDPRLISTGVQRELRAIDPTIGIDDVKTMEAIRDESVESQLFIMRVLVVFSLIGTVLALVGIYGLISLSVNSRKRELGIRMALGAGRKEVLLMVLRQGMTLIVPGLALGTVMAILSASVLRAFLFGVAPTDPTTFGQVALLFTAAGVTACYFPARRAARVDPNDVLRSE